jgi:hypothetical protein
MAAASTQAARRTAAAPARTARPRARPTRRTSGSATSRSSVSPARAARVRSTTPTRLVPLAVGRTAVAVSGLADSGLVHRLTRGRLWIGALTTLLVGIVSLNVLALSFNASSSRVGRQADALNREISALRAEIATNGASNQRVQAAAAKLGLIVPEPGSVGYLRPSPDDAAVAAKRLASGELTAQPSYVAPLAPVSVPTPTATSPPATDQTAVTQPTQTAPATDTTVASTTEPTSLQAAPASGQGAGGVAPGGGGGVVAP